MLDNQRYQVSNNFNHNKTKNTNINSSRLSSSTTTWYELSKWVSPALGSTTSKRKKNKYVQTKKIQSEDQKLEFLPLANVK